MRWKRNGLFTLQFYKMIYTTSLRIRDGYMRPAQRVNDFIHYSWFGSFFFLFFFSISLYFVLVSVLIPNVCVFCTVEFSIYSWKWNFARWIVIYKSKEEIKSCDKAQSLILIKCKKKKENGKIRICTYDFFYIYSGWNHNDKRLRKKEK